MRAVLLLAILLSCAGGLFAQARKAPGRKPPPHLAVERFSRMSPEQRQRMLEKLPPERKAKVEQRLERFNNLPPETKKRLRDEFDRFQQLSPDQQDTVRKTFRVFNELPQERRPAVRRELHRLRLMPQSERQARLTSDEFRSRFNSDEQGMLETLSGLLGPE